MTERAATHDSPRRDDTCAIEAAAEAHLRYVSDAEPGIRRRRHGEEFVYIGPDDAEVDDAATLVRIKSLVIPPAWDDVWICARANGHLQATGRDARGRKQYRYHPRWREVRDRAKFGHMLGFGKSLPLLRKHVDADLGKRGLPREKVIAAVVSLLEHTLIRVGNDEYARDNGSFGLTTLRNRHAKVNASHVSFDFVGKSGKRHRVEFNDRRLATIIQRCHEIPGQHLFAYIDEDGERQNVTSADVNDYIREATGGDFTAKDFRTWTATVLAHTRLQLCGPPETARAANRHVVETVKVVADELRNTAAVCRKCYIHPAVLEGYVPGAAVPAPARKRRGLSVEESAVLSLLERESTAQKPRPRGRANRAKPAPARTP